MLTEKRMGDPRDPCALPALVITADGAVGADCVVIDISVRGVRIEVEPSLPLPPRFVLALPLVEDVKDNRAVELRWRRDRHAGLRFLPGSEPAAQAQAQAPVDGEP